MANCFIGSDNKKRIQRYFLKKVNEYLQSNDESKDVDFNNYMTQLLTSIRNQYTSESANEAKDIIRDALNGFRGGSFWNELEKRKGIRDWFFKGNRKDGQKIANTIKQNNVVNTAWDVDEANTDILYENNGLKYNPNNRFIYKAFGTAQKPMQYAINKANSRIASACFLNRGIINGSIGAPQTTAELNHNINRCQELMFQDIKNFLNYLVLNKGLRLNQQETDIINPENNLGLYDVVSSTNIQNVTNNLRILKTTLENIFSEINPDKLNDYYNRIKNNAADTDLRRRSKLALDAYSSYVFLNNFDSHLKILLDKSIQINENEFGRRVASNDKYQIAGKISKNLPIWRTSENVVIGDEVNDVVKLLINTTPFLKWGQKLVYLNEGIDDFDETRYLSFQHFQHIVPKIRDVVFNTAGGNVVFNSEYYAPVGEDVDKSSVRFKKATAWLQLDELSQKTLKNKSLYDVVAEASSNPKTNWHAIFNILSNPTFRKIADNAIMYSNFDLFELDLINSFAEGVFSGLNSLYRYSQVGDDVDYYGFLTQTANTIYNTKFVLLYMDDDGKINTRYLKDLSTDNIRRSLETNINNLNSKNHSIWDNFISQFPIVDDDTQVIENREDDDKNRLKNIEFIVPGSNARLTVGYDGTFEMYDISTNQKADIKNFTKSSRQEKAIWHFVDNILALNASGDSDFRNFLKEEFKNSANTTLDSLLKFAGRVFANRYLSNMYIHSKDDYKNIKNISFWGKNKLPGYNDSMDEMNLIMSSLDWATLRGIANAKSKLLGLSTSITVKNSKGNQLSNQTFNRLLGSYKSLFHLKEMKKNSASKHFTILNDPGLFDGIYISEEYADSYGETKPFSKMSVKELTEAQFKHSFVSGLVVPEDTKDYFLSNGNSMFYIGVMTDRTLFPQMRCNLYQGIKKLGGKNLYELTPLERARFTCQELGTFYLNSFRDVYNTLNKIGEYIFDKDMEEGVGVSLVPDNLGNDYIKDFAEFNKWYKDIGKKTFGYNTPTEFMRAMVLEYNKKNPTQPIKLTDQIHFKEGKNGNLASNRTFLAQLARYNQNPRLSQFIRRNRILIGDEIEDFQTYDQFHKEQSFRLLKSMTDSLFKMDLDDNSVQTQKIIEELNKYRKEGSENYIGDSKKMILAYLSYNNDGKVTKIPITSSSDLLYNNIDLTNKTISTKKGLFSIDIELNPLIEQWNDLDFLLTQEFNCATGGSFIAHPDKSKSAITLALESNQNISNTKRNNVYASQVNQFSFSAIDEAPSQYKIAIMQEFYTKCPTINGLENPTDTTNAATFVHPAFVHLENKSIYGSTSGVDKKPFVFFKDSNIGNGGEDKTACFGITNNKMRNQPILKRAFFKMANNEWRDKNGNIVSVDITRNCLNGRRVDYITKYFRKAKDERTPNGNIKKVAGYYRIDDIQRTEDTGNPNAYVRHITEVDEYGREIGETTPEYFTINTNYDLWNLFGGEWSMRYNDEYGKLIPSEDSILDLVTAMNYTSNQDYSNFNGHKDQNSVWQPLKKADIAWLTTIEAVKYGGGNINHANKIRDPKNTEDLDWFYVDMYNAGIQLDKEHSSDNLDISLMTQVMNACALKGYTFYEADDMYRALNMLTQTYLKNFTEPLKEYFKTGNSEAYNNFETEIKRQIVETLINSKSPDTANNLITSIAEEAKKENGTIDFSLLKIPFSDNMLYNKILSTISVFLTDMGIRTKIPGSLSILCPADDFYKLYDGRKYESFVDPETELEEIQLIYRTEKAVFDIRQEDKNDPELASNIELGRMYYITRDGEDENINKPQLVATPNDLFVILDDCRDGDIVKIVEDVKDGRNLSAYNVRFKEILPEGATRKSPRAFQLWNLDCMRYIFDLNTAKQTTLKTKIPEWASLANIYRNLFNEDPQWDTEKDNFFLRANETERLIRRRQLQELRNLTVGASDVQSQFQKIQQEVNAAYETGDDKLVKQTLQKYAQWVNIYFGTGYGSKMYINQLVNENGDILDNWLTTQRENTGIISFEFDTDNSLNVPSKDGFDYLNTLVLDKINKSLKVLINGEYVDVDKGSIKISPYETITNKLNASVFGLDETSDLKTILEDENFFVKQSLRNYMSKLTNRQYNIELKSDNGRHNYLLFKSCLLNQEAQGLHRVDNYLYLNENNHTYRVTSGGRRLYEIYPGTEIYADNNGNEVLVIDDTVINNNAEDTVKLYIDSLPHNDIQISTVGFTDHLTEFNKIISILSSANDKFAKQLIRRIVNYARNNNEDLINPNSIAYVISEIQKSGSNNIDPDNVDEFNKWLTVNHGINKLSNIYLSGLEKYASFVRSLENIQSRTPAQCMQSFMTGTIVAFENPDSNEAYVSPYQILIQGSDFDIDTVNITSFDFNNNGKLQIWSPYADIRTHEKLLASESFPFPTETEVEQISNSDDIEGIFNFIDNNLSKNFHVRRNRLHILKITPKLSTALDIKNFGETIKNSYLFKNLSSNNDELNANIKEYFENKYEDGLNVGRTNINADDLPELFNLLTKIINNHNLYFSLDNVSDWNKIKACNNYLVKNVCNISKSPNNLILSMESVDLSTEPLKDIINERNKGNDEGYFGPGNVVAKFQNMNNVLVGKNGVGIYAVSMKVFEGLTHYYNTLLNRGTAEEQEKVLLGKDGKGVSINGKTYYLLANVKPVDINTVKNPKVLKALSNETQDNDASITTSAMMSLAVDNAKEMKLYQMNATEKTMGMYSYATAIGMDFDEIANIMMSPTGKIITQLSEGNVFIDDNGFYNIGKAVDYLKGDFGDVMSGYPVFIKLRLIYNLNGKLGEEENSKPTNPKFLKFIEDHKIKGDFSRLDKLTSNLFNFLSYTSEGENSNAILKQKLEILDKAKVVQADMAKSFKEEYLKLIDFLKEYTIQVDSVYNDKIKGHDGKERLRIDAIDELQKGALEFFEMGQIFGANQGIKTKLADFLKQIGRIEWAVFDKKAAKEKNNQDIINISKFTFDPDYQKKMINEYKKVMHTINILDAAVSVPHFYGYLQTIGIDLMGKQKSFKFRSIRKMLPVVKNETKEYNINKIYRGLENYLNDYIKNEWLSFLNPIFIPKGNWIFDKNGEKKVAKKDTLIRLGTDWTNATFRTWMERQVIPSLQNGSDDRGNSVTVMNNGFIKALGYSQLNNRVSNNTTSVISLPINMSPTTEYEKGILSSYVNEFNKLLRPNYNYKYTIKRANGRDYTQEQRSLNLVDLFTYYTMIAHNWERRENSLFTIFEDFLNTGKIKDFHDYIASLDDSNFTLNLDQGLSEDVLPYIARKGNPYRSNGNYLWGKDKETKQMYLMEKAPKPTREEEEQMVVDQEGQQFKSRSLYRPHTIPLKTVSQFPLNRSLKERNITFDINDKSVNIIYDPLNKSIKQLLIRQQKEINGKLEPVITTIDGIKELPILKDNGLERSNGKLIIDIETLDDLIDEEMGVCS